MSSKAHEKLIQEIGSMTVLELSDLVKALEETFGVSAAMPVAAAGAAAAPAAAEAPKAQEKAEYKVTLKDGGPEKIKTIKVLRKHLPDMNLSDAKKAVDEAPTVIAEAASKDLSMAMKKDLEEVGAKVELA